MLSPTERQHLAALDAVADAELRLQQAREHLAATTAALAATRRTA